MMASYLFHITYAWPIYIYIYIPQAIYLFWEKNCPSFAPLLFGIVFPPFDLIKFFAGAL